MKNSIWGHFVLYQTCIPSQSLLFLEAGTSLPSVIAANFFGSLHFGVSKFAATIDGKFSDF
jgi:hypothetical protein